MSPPDKHLGPDPVIDSPEAVDTALHWMRYLGLVYQTAKAKADEACQQIAAELTAACQLKVGKHKVEAQQYRSLLEQRVIAFAVDEETKGQLFTTGKTYKSAFGTVAARVGVPSLAQVDPDADVLATILEDRDLQPELDRIRDEFRLVDWIKLEPKLDRAGILKAYKEQRITDEDLAAVGLKVDPAMDKVTVSV